MFTTQNLAPEVQVHSLDPLGLSWPPALFSGTAFWNDIPVTFVLATLYLII